MYQTQVSGKKVDADGKKNSAAQNLVFDNAEKVANKFQGEKTDLAKDPKAIYNVMGLQLSSTKKQDEISAQISNIVGKSLMQRVANTPAKSVEEISTAANFAYDDILADDEQALFAMAGLKQPLNAPSLANMQKTLNESHFVNALFA